MAGNSGRRDRDRNGRRPRRGKPPVKPPVSPKQPPIDRSAPKITDRRALDELLAGIGVPPPAPFAPDNFQLEALQTLVHQDVLVTAPTGSGKTWIAREEIRRLLGTGRKIWYTTPLKALTNSKYQEFIDEFGAARVKVSVAKLGILKDAGLVGVTVERTKA